MKHQTLDELHAIAEVQNLPPYPMMTRNQRIERWGELLEQHPTRRLAALTATEHLDPTARDAAHEAGSAITVALEDPVLRALGLKTDTYGEAKRFFELTDWQLHHIVCSCHSGATMESGWAATRVRATMSGNGFFAWLWQRIAR